MASQRRRTGQNDKVAKSTPSAGQRTNPKAAKPAKSTSKVKYTPASQKRTGQNSKTATLTTGGGSRRGSAAGTRSSKPAPKPTPKPQQGDYVSPYAGSRDAAHQAASKIQGSPVVGPRLVSPAIGAPVHARPSAFGSAQGIATGSAYVQAPTTRPSTPGQAALQQPGMSPQYGGNDEPGRLGQQEGGYAGKPQPQQAPTDGPDMERRRAFLDADNSLDGMKAVRDLLNRRKLSIAVEH